ncbi:hypothetical protein CS0771_60910 [Catellatospora sp. IY07-71]|nr:hypothetical protein CS0771_60910 [Catellatospora sp. IY07-71]
MWLVPPGGPVHPEWTGSLVPGRPDDATVPDARSKRPPEPTLPPGRPRVIAFAQTYGAGVVHA